MRAKNGCWTCKARRLQCDGGVPVCQRCARAQRKCQGYGMRLSWPRDNDKKRAITGDSPSALTRPSQQRKLFYVNATCRDVELYRYLSQRIQPPRSVQPFPHLWGQPQLSANYLDLVYFFHTSAYDSLVTFDLNTSRIRDALLRMAMAHDTLSGSALLYALLAFSSLRRSGAHQQALQLKILALQSLAASTNDGSLTSAEAAQHLAASMLLGSFEILLPSGSSDEWLSYIRGATDIIQATHLEEQSHEGDIGHLLDWFYYHQALSRFSIQHWRHKPLGRLEEATHTIPSEPRVLDSISLTRHAPSPPSPNPSHAILNLLSEACDTVLDPWDHRSRNEDYHLRLRALETRIGGLVIMPSSAGPKTGVELAVEIYQIATQIYLVRASQSSWESSTGLDALIDRAFAIPLVSCECSHFFPLFIVACEARTDEQRATILSLIGKAETSMRGRNMEWLRGVVQSVWVQQDLHADGDLLVDYLGMISTVISSSNALPSFV
ncbi:hypothetical protein CONLIGDRAFT_671996 [Coniochaeta ligniaria NRRL 30616]|uniref:Zn(2)-C6 fungal-type domain-containing protein n=1 Tax=Coniochaeta ligniaria NRRL 30616 TaxID=1408157 RepID=A0A1J7IFE9_9PEZI|nr:hypothetical protein CONLIGDRAFT_671996 [Coniochaeta ligniaria NRRL 30616]